MAHPHTNTPNAEKPTRRPSRTATAKDMSLNQNGYRTSGNVPTQHRTGVRLLL